jgi:outer membrane lipoprotein SlyB
MLNVKDTLGTAKNNIVGTIVGAGAGYLASKKLIKTDKLWLTITSALVGGVLGAIVQSKMKAKAGVPTAATVKK